MLLILDLLNFNEVGNGLNHSQNRGVNLFFYYGVELTKAESLNSFSLLRFTADCAANELNTNLSSHN